MSFEAMSLAMRLDIRPSGTKFVLVALANCADEKGLCWPSIDHLSQVTAQDRKTVMLSLQRLEADRWIFDTRNRKGRTGQVKVLCLNLAQMIDPPMFHADRKGTENGLLSDAVKSAENGMLSPGNSTESGTVAADNSTESGTLPLPTAEDNGTNSGMLHPPNGTGNGTVEAETVPFFPRNSTENGTRNLSMNQEQGVVACVPVRTREEQLAALSRFDREVIDPYLDRLPPSIELELFASFVKHRKVANRVLSISSYAQLLADFRLYAGEGIDLNESLRTTLALGLCRPVRPTSRGSPGHRQRPRVNDNFDNANYQATPHDELPPELR